MIICSSMRQISFLFCPLNISNISSEYRLIDFHYIYHRGKKHNHRFTRCKILHKECGTISDVEAYRFIKWHSCSNKKCHYDRIKKKNLELYGVDNPFRDVSKVKAGKFKKYGDDKYTNPIKTKSTLMKKYGVGCIGQINVKDRLKSVRDSNMKKYGVEFPMALKLFRDKAYMTKIDIGSIIPLDDMPLFKRYERKIDKLTKRNVAALFRNWNGYDHYDGEYIKHLIFSKSNRKLQPTVDHKVSKIFGFKHGISPEEISDFPNLCITKHKINASKSFRTEFEFGSKIKLIEYNPMPC